MSSELASGCRVVKAQGEIDLDTAPKLREQLLDAVLYGKGDVVLDMSDVTFVDSTAIAVLVTIHKRLDTGGRKLVLRSPSGSVRRVLELCGLDGFWPLDDGRVNG